MRRGYSVRSGSGSVPECDAGGVDSSGNRLDTESGDRRQYPDTPLDECDSVATVAVGESRQVDSEQPIGESGDAAWHALSGHRVRHDCLSLPIDA